MPTAVKANVYDELNKADLYIQVKNTVSIHSDKCDTVLY